MPIITHDRSRTLIMPAPSSLEINLSVRFTGGEAQENKIDFYDGSESLFGFSRALLLSTSYLLTGKVNFQAPSVKGAKVYMLTSRPGSFEQIIQLVIQNPAAAAFGLVTGQRLWAFTKSVLTKSVGQPDESDSDFVKSIQGQKEADLDSLNEAVTSPIKMAHRFVGADHSSKKISFGSVSDRIVLDERTRDYLFIRTVESKFTDFTGNISSYNIHRKTGRIFDLELGRTVPFAFDKEGRTSADTTPITWSIDQNNRGLPGHIEPAGNVWTV
jgi:hypothetical protein